VVLVVGVVAMALNILLYFGYFLPRMTPLVAHINPIVLSVPEAISKLGTEAGSKSDPEADSNSGAGASGESVPEGTVGSQTDYSSAHSPSGLPPNSPCLSALAEASASSAEAFASTEAPVIVWSAWKVSFPEVGLPLYGVI
jgi:hypothetical protein